MGLLLGYIVTFLGSSILNVLGGVPFVPVQTLFVARTMGMIAFSISNVAFSFATKDEQRSIFSLDIMGDRPFLYATAASIATIVLMTEFGLFRRILDTTNLALDQWVVCILVGLLIVPVSEIRKLIVKTPIDEAPSEAAPGAAAVIAP